LELVVPEVAVQVTKTLSIPTIGIGAGEGTTGQIRVTHDLLGLTPWGHPSFVKEDLGFSRQIGQMVTELRKNGRALRG